MVCTYEIYCTDISDCVSKKSVSTLSFDSITGEKLPENTDYDIERSNSKIINKHYFSLLLIIILLIID